MRLRIVLSWRAHVLQNSVRTRNTYAVGDSNGRRAHVTYCPRVRDGPLAVSPGDHS